MAAQLASSLHLQFNKFRSKKEEICQFLSTLETHRKNKKSGELPLNYMLQLPPQTNSREVEKWIHTLPDKLTGKTNCEMRLELCLIKECTSQVEALHEKVSKLISSSSVSYADWGRLANELSLMDFTVLQDDWLQLEFW